MKASAISGSAKAQLREAVLHLKSANGRIDIPAARQSFRRRIARGDTAILSLLGALTATRVSAATAEAEPAAPLAVANSLEDLLDFGEPCLPGQLYNPASDEEHDHSVISSSAAAHGNHESDHGAHGGDPFASRFANKYAREHNHHSGHEAHKTSSGNNHAEHHSAHQSGGAHAQHGGHGSHHAAAAGGQDHDGHGLSHKDRTDAHTDHSEADNHKSHATHDTHAHSHHGQMGHAENHDHRGAHSENHSADQLSHEQSHHMDSDTSISPVAAPTIHAEGQHNNHAMDAVASAHDMTLALMDIASTDGIAFMPPPEI